MRYNEAYLIYREELIAAGTLWIRDYIEKSQDKDEVLYYFEDIYSDMEFNITGDSTGQRDRMTGSTVSKEELATAMLWDKNYISWLNDLDATLNDVFDSSDIADIYAACYVCEDLYGDFYTICANMIGEENGN